jgi:cobalt-zinc-cadmium resistance protein CzcA
MVVSANVRGRDLGSFVSEAEQTLNAQVKIPAGYWTTWGGHLRELQSASKRLQDRRARLAAAGLHAAVRHVRQ